MEDLVAGQVTRELTDREAVDPDFVIVRSDGHPVFHFVNVVDDLDMGITHVIRGEDHLSNTPKHIQLFRAFGVQPPKYAHIPLILNTDGSKMSKRDLGASLDSYVEGGFLPEAVLNYLCLLGWSPKEDREKMDIADVIERFDLPQVLRHNARFDMAKLEWLNGEYLRDMPREKFFTEAVLAFARAGIDTNKWPLEYVRSALATCLGKVKRFSDLPHYAGFYFADKVEITSDALAKDFTAENVPRIKQLRDAFDQCADFNAEALEALLKSVAKECGVKNGVLVHPVRLACTGATAGPSLYHLLEVLGREQVLRRLDDALAATTGP
jgi:glutamyl-tRNA synthetase